MCFDPISATATALAAFTSMSAASAAAAAPAVLLSGVGATVGAIGAGVSAYAGYKQSQFQAQVAKNNEIISGYNANSSLLEGQESETLSREATSRKVGAELAAQGANGLDVGFGTTEGVRSATQNEGDLDALTIRYNAAQRAAGYATQGLGFEAEQSADKAAGMNSLVAGGINIGSSIIGGAQSIANIRFQQSLFSNKGSNINVGG